MNTKFSILPQDFYLSVIKDYKDYNEAQKALIIAALDHLDWELSTNTDDHLSYDYSPKIDTFQVFFEDQGSGSIQMEITVTATPKKEYSAEGWTDNYLIAMSFPDHDLDRELI